jgi:hypothetical protein
VQKFDEEISCEDRDEDEKAIMKRDLRKLVVAMYSGL